MRSRLRRKTSGTSPPAPARLRRGASGARHPGASGPPPIPVKAPAPRSTPGDQRERRSGGPEDRALYVCRCGSAFQAPVVASVRCPHCGDVQAW